MSAITDFFSNYVTEITLIMIIVAIAVMVLVVYLTNRSVEKTIEETVDTEALEKEKKKKEEAEQKKAREKYLPIPEDKTPPFGGWVSRYLTLKGYFRVGDLSLIFLRGLNLLRDRLDTVHYKTFLPWYLMVGISDSGKSSLMRRSEFILPLGEPDFDLPEENPGLKWWFLNRGIVLDVRGDFLLNKRGVRADEKGWQTIIALLARYRSRRPLDGIILAIPATELYGGAKLSLEEITDRARYMAQKLQTTQNFLGLRLPVYVVVTKTDLVPGFKSLCQSIPVENRHNILGWSSPYHLSTAFDKNWVAEAFGHLHNQLNKLKMEILAEGASELTRDGVFVFPNELMHLQKPISIYINSIFNVSSYNESLLLRGIFFTGDSGENIDASEIFATREILREDDKDSVVTLKVGDMERDPMLPHPSSTTLFFFNDLLNKKIFKETGLAQPIHQRLISANRNILLAKAGMIGFLGFSTYGVIKAYENFSHNRDYLLPVLGKINTILYQIPETRLDQTHLSAHTFDDQTRQLLDMMNNLHRTSFFSLFMPSSWFSPIHESLETSLKVSYDQIILRTIYMDLLLKARDMLTFKPQSSEVSTSFADLLQPTRTVEFDLFQDYVLRFIDLSHHIDKFNRLQDSTDGELLQDLVLYTLGTELPKEFIDNYGHFRQVLSDIPYAKIDLKPYQGTARETLKGLYTHFITNLLSPTHPNSIVGRINYIIDQYGIRKSLDLPDLRPLRSFSQDLNEVMPILGERGHTWMDNSFFDGGVVFSDIMGEVNQFKLFGPEMVQLFGLMTAKQFAAFQQKMQYLNSLLVPKKPGTEFKKIHPSECLYVLQENLNKFFKQRFMAQPSGETFITNIPADHVVYWDPKLIDMAIEDIKEYEDFIRHSFDDLPVAIRGTLKENARANLVGNIVSLIGKAQTVLPQPIGRSDIASAEETLRNKIEDVKTISPKFIKLLEVMGESNVGESYVALRNLLGTLSTRLLAQADQILEGFGLYKVKDNNFNWWDGNTSPMLDGFSARDETELAQNLERQRSLVRRLALDYATYMIQFLTSPVIKDYQMNPGLINKWKGIIEQIDGYERKTPDNTLFQLEETIMKDLLSVDLKKCFIAIPLAEVRRGSVDFFASRRIELRKGLLARCEVLRRQESINNYTQLANLFNERLKDRFPFMAQPTADSPEVEPDDIRQFFSLYDSMGRTPKEIYDQVYQLGADAQDTFAFLSAMDKIRGFFSPYLLSALSGEVPAFDFEVEFHINQEREVGANMIGEWTLRPDPVTEITNHDNKKTGKWSFGNAVELGLSWPQVSPLQPYNDPKQPNLQVIKTQATFSYPGRWALLGMIHKQQALNTDYSPLTNPVPYVLKFEIPNGPEEKTIAFMRITLLEPSTGNQGNKPMRVPTFPALAPDIPEKVLAKATIPILVMGPRLASEAINVLPQAQLVPQVQAGSVAPAAAPVGAVAGVPAG